MSESPPSASTVAEQADHVGARFSGFGLSWSRASGNTPSRCAEAAVVVPPFSTRSAWPGGDPGPFLPVAVWPGRGTMSSSDLNASNPPALVKRLPDQDVLVGEGQHGPPVLLGHHRPQHRVALEVRRIRCNPMSTLGVPPMRSRVEKAKPLSIDRHARGSRAPRPRSALRAVPPRTVRAVGTHVSSSASRVTRRRCASERARSLWSRSSIPCSQ